MKKVMVFGIGLIGGFIANKLSRKYKVAAYDGNQLALHKLDKRIDRYCGFFEDQEHVLESINHYDPDIIVNASPGYLGYNMLKTAILLSRNIVDIAFMPEDPLVLNDEAIKNNVTAVVDFGFSPGMGNMFVGRANKLLDKHEGSVIYVGGLQLDSDDYKAVYSPIDLIQVYSRPARFLRDGKMKTTIPFLEKFEYILGEGKQKLVLRGFASDGARTLLTTLDVPNILEITLRTAEHFVLIQSLIKNGFFKEEHLENTSKVLLDKWKMTEKDHDYSILHTTSKGGGKQIDHFMYDEYDINTKTYSMARVTGLPVIAIVEAILEKRYTEKGVIPPEYVAKNDEVYNFVVEYLQNYGITITEKKIEI